MWTETYCSLKELTKTKQIWAILHAREPTQQNSSASSPSVRDCRHYQWCFPTPTVVNTACPTSTLTPCWVGLACFDLFSHVGELGWHTFAQFRLCSAIWFLLRYLWAALFPTPWKLLSLHEVIPIQTKKWSPLYFHLLVCFSLSCHLIFINCLHLPQESCDTKLLWGYRDFICPLRVFADLLPQVYLLHMFCLLWF